VTYNLAGNQLASAGVDGTIKVWEATTGREVYTLRAHTGPVSDLVYSPDGTRLASIGLDRALRIWDATTGQEFRNLDGGRAAEVGRILAFSPDGSALALAQGSHRTVQVWDVTSGRAAFTLTSPASDIFGVTYSPDGTRLAMAQQAQVVKLWDVRSRREILGLRGPRSMVRAVAYSPDGTRLAAVTYGSTVKIWDGRPWKPEARAEQEALGLLECLFGKPLAKADVLDYLRRSPTISPAARRLALELAECYREDRNPEHYHQAARSLLRRPHLNAFQYGFALRQAQTACRLVPGQERYQTTLGLAEYRNGQYAEALASLTGAEPLHRTTAAGLAVPPAPLLPALTALGQAQQLRQIIVESMAFLAMTQHRLGQQEQARATLARLRELLAEPAGANDAESAALLREAEALIEGKVPDPKK
jgi:hypothetical protein